jgi:hypothetical protein
MAATPCGTRVADAKSCVKNPPAKAGKRFTYIDLTGRPGERVSPRLPSKGHDKTTSLQDPQELGHVRPRDVFGTRYLGNRERSPWFGLREGQQAPKAVFFLG